jgi:predicted transposase YdaD
VIEREYANVEEVQSMLIKAIERDREQLLKTGEARGEARGRAERTQQIVQAMHTRGFDPTLIADIVGLTSAEVAAMLAQPASTPQPPRPRKRRKS